MARGRGCFRQRRQSPPLPPVFPRRNSFYLAKTTSPDRNGMPLLANGRKWSVNKIAVIGPGIVGTPMAALLAAGTEEEDPPVVVVIQRPSSTSGWKVDAINRGESPIGGVEPALDGLIADG